MEKWYYRESNFQNWCTTEHTDTFTYIGCHYVDLVHFITGLPKTRSGKMLRRSIQALAEGRDPGDLTTIDDPSTLEQIKAVLKG